MDNFINKFLDNYRALQDKANKEAEKLSFSRLARDDGRKVDLAGYEDRIEKIAKDVENSRNIDEALDIMRNYANDKELQNFVIYDKDLTKNTVSNAWRPYTMFNNSISEFEDMARNGQEVDFNDWKDYVTSSIRENMSVVNRSKGLYDLSKDLESGKRQMGRPADEGQFASFRFKK